MPSWRATAVSSASEAPATVISFRASDMTITE